MSFLKVIIGLGIGIGGGLALIYGLSYLEEKAEKKAHDSWKFVMDQEMEVETRKR